MVRRVLTVLAIGIALAAQQLVIDRSRSTYGWMLYGLAAGLIGFAAWQRRSEPSRPRWDGVIVWRWWEWIWLVAAFAALTATTWLSVSDSLPVVAVGLWLASFGCATAGLWRVVLTPPLRDVPKWSRGEQIALAVILILGAVARVVWIDTIPRFYFDDESRVGIYLRETYRYAVPNFFTMGWNTWPVVGLSLQGIFTPLLGLNTTALRLGSALSGTLAILTLHLLGRQLFSPRIGLLAALLFACGRTALDFSRMGICHAQVLLFETFAFYFLWRAINTGRAVSYLWAGIGLGWCLYTYNAGQLVPLLCLGWLALSTVVRPRTLASHWRGVLVTIVGLVLTIGPYVVFATDQFTFAANWHEFTGMARNRQTLGRIVESWRGLGAEVAMPMIREQVENTWLGFTVLPANAYALGYRGGGMLDYVSGPLFILGLAVCAANVLSPRHAFLLYWWLVTTIMGGVLTQAPPAFVRMVGLLPAVALLGALPLDWLLRLCSGTYFPAIAARGLVALLLLGVIWDNWRTYFVAFPRETRWPASELAHALQAVPDKGLTLLVGTEHFVQFRAELFQLDFADQRLEDVAQPADLLPLRQRPDNPFTLVFGPTQLTLAEYATALYPGATVSDIYLANEPQPQFRIVRLTAAQVGERQGLRLQAFGDNDTHVASLTADPFAQRPQQAATAKRLEWSGSFYWPSDRSATLTVTTTGRARVTVAHHTLAAADAATPISVSLQLPRGWQPFRIEEEPGSPRDLAVSITDRGVNRPIVARELRPDGMDQGLLAVYQRGDAIALRQVEPLLDAFAVEDLFRSPNDVPLRMPFRAQWTGALEIARPGLYQFDAIGSGPYVIQLGGETLFDETVRVPEEPRTVTRSRMMEVGSYPFSAVWDSTRKAHTSRRIFQLYWTPPGGERSLVLPSSFRLPATAEVAAPLPTIAVTPTPTPIRIEAGSRMSLADMTATSIEYGYAPPRINQSWNGPPITMGGKTYDRGIGVHAWSRLTYSVPPGAIALEAIIGLSDGVKECAKASVTFEVRDQKDAVLYDSGVINADTGPQLVRVPLQGASAVTLAVTDAGNGIDCDHANWAMPSFLVP